MACFLVNVAYIINFILATYLNVATLETAIHSYFHI